MELAVFPRSGQAGVGWGSEPELARRLGAHVEASVISLLDPLRLEMMAEVLRVLERRRKHKPGLIVCALVLSAFERKADTEGRWLDAQAVYRQLGGPDSSDSSFQDQVRKLLPVMQELQRRRFRELGERATSTELKGQLASFADVLIADGCAFKVATALSRLYPGTGNDAELKLHAVYSVRAHSAVTVGISAGSTHDSDGFWPASWQRHALYLWDLGFNSRKRFIDAAQAGAHVLQRLKTSDNPRVVASYSPSSTRQAVILWGGAHPKLNEALEGRMLHAQRVLDLDVQLRDGARSIVARVVCVPCGGEDRYYMTTLPRAAFTPQEIAELYRLRWEIELFFKDWKGVVHIDAVRQLKNPQSILVAVTASILAALLARDIAAALQNISADSPVVNPAAITAASPP